MDGFRFKRQSDIRIKIRCKHSNSKEEKASCFFFLCAAINITALSAVVEPSEIGMNSVCLNTSLSFECEPAS